MSKVLSRRDFLKVAAEFLAAAIPAELVDDHLEDAATVAQELIGAGFLPHQVHTLLRSLVGRASM